MVYKKYTSKGGKLYGPYLYENKRVGDKVVTSYIGKNKNKNVFSYILIAIVLIAFFYFLFFISKNPVGRASLELDLVYDVGEPILGEMKFNLKEGEFVPRDAEVVIDYGNQSKTYKLYELIVDAPTNGNFFAENTKISGEGEGFGVLGNKIIYPELSFDLLVYDLDEEPEDILISGSDSSDSDEQNDSSFESSDSSDVSVSDDEEVVVESPSEEIPADEQEDSPSSSSDSEKEDSSDDSSDSSSPPSESADSSSSSSDSQQESSSASSNDGSGSSGSSSDSSSSSSSDSQQESSSESSSDSSSSGESSGGDSSSSSEGSSESSSEGDGGGSSDSGAGVTGAVVTEGEYIVSGVVKTGSDFSYNLEEGKSAKIVEGSVKIGNESISDSSISLEIGEGKVAVLTKYFINEEGYGLEYLGDFALTLRVKMENVGLYAQPGIIKVSLVYGGESIASDEQGIAVEIEEEENETELDNNVTFTSGNISLLEEISSLRIGINDSVTLNLKE